MQRGRKPQPTATKKLRGNPRKRPLNKDEPQPKAPGKLPDPPAHLGVVGKREWRRIGKELLATGLYTVVDRSALAAYCAVYENWVDAHQHVIDDGLLTKTKAGNTVQNPYLSIANKQLELMNRFLTEFGMTPSSRSRVSVEVPKEKDPFDAFLSENVLPMKGKERK
jgi:P27 family predicted phage terminase small subunit